MRIAYIIADRHIPVFGNKGASIHVQEMIKAFSALGHELKVYAANIGDDHGEINARFIRVEHNAAETRNILQTVQQNNSLKRCQKEQQAMALATEIANRVVEDAKQQPIDFIYERYSLFSTAGIDAARSLAIPSLIEVNAPLIEEQVAYRQLIHLENARQIEHQVFNRASSVLAVSDQVRDYIQDKLSETSCSPDSRIQVVPNGVDVSRFHPEIAAAPLFAAQMTADPTVIGFVGSLKPWHGLDVLLRAFQQLITEKLALHLLIIGEGPSRNWIQGFIDGAKLNDHVTVTGWVDNRTLPSYIKAMDLAVAPYPASENFYFSPLKLYEYLAVGVPVVASRIGQVEDVMKDQEVGLMCVPGCVEDLASKIRRLADDPPLRSKLSRNAVTATVSCTWQRNAANAVSIVSQEARAE